MLAHHCQGAEGGWLKMMIAGSFGGKNTYQILIELKLWLLVVFAAKTLIKILIFRISDFQPISCGCKLSCKSPHVMCLSSCKSNDNLCNIFTEGIRYSATVCRIVCASLRICSSSFGTRKNVSNFLYYRWSVSLIQVDTSSLQQCMASLLGCLQSADFYSREVIYFLFSPKYYPLVHYVQRS